MEVAIIFMFPWNVGSPISDLNPIFMSAGCTLELVSKANGVSEIYKMPMTNLVFDVFPIKSKHI